jgi:hypothetical protein
VMVDITTIGKTIYYRRQKQSEGSNLTLEIATIPNLKHLANLPEK